jgi:DNA-binding protein HU-beta
VNKSEFIEAVAGRYDGDKKAASNAIEAFIQTVYSTVSKGEKLSVTGFGVFEKRDRAARMARNPRTGASVRVKKTSVPAFRPGAEFKDIISGAKKMPKVAAVKAAPAKKVAAVKAPAKKVAAVKAAPAKKVAAVKAPAKKVAAVKAAPAKKAPAKKAPAKKAAR